MSMSDWSALCSPREDPAVWFHLKWSRSCDEAAPWCSFNSLCWSSTSHLKLLHKMVQNISLQLLVPKAGSGPTQNAFFKKDVTWRKLPFSGQVPKNGNQPSPRGSKTSSPSLLGSQQGCRGHFPRLLAPPAEEETSPGFLFLWLNAPTTKHLNKRTGTPKTSTGSWVLKGRQINAAHRWSTNLWQVLGSEGFLTGKTVDFLLLRNNWRPGRCAWCLK